MRIVSMNLNGIRAAGRKGFFTGCRGRRLMWCARRNSRRRKNKSSAACTGRPAFSATTIRPSARATADGRLLPGRGVRGQYPLFDSIGQQQRGCHAFAVSVVKLFQHGGSLGTAPAAEHRLSATAGISAHGRMCQSGSRKPQSAFAAERKYSVEASKDRSWPEDANHAA